MARKKVLQLMAAAVLAASLPVLAVAGNNNKGNQANKPGTSTTTSPSTTEADSLIVDQGGYPNAVAVDLAGRPCAAYFMGSELRFAVYNGATWSIQSVGRVGGDYGASALDMAVNASGRPGIVFYVSHDGGVVVNHVRFASFDGAAWKVEIVDGSGFAPSIAVGPFGEWLVAYGRTDSGGIALNIAENFGSGWRISTVDSSNPTGYRRVYAPSIAMDGSGNAGIAYGYYVANLTRQVRYAYRAGGAWSVKTVNYDVSNSNALVYDSANMPRIAYYTGSGSFQLAAPDAAGRWITWVIPWSGTGAAGQISLALDSSGLNYISAFASGSADLLLISGSPGDFSSRMLASTGAVGRSNSLHIDKMSGKKCLTFSDQTVGVLKFMGL